MQTGPIAVELSLLRLRINVSLDSKIDGILPDFDNCKLSALQRGNLYSQTSETTDTSSRKDKAVEQNIKILGTIGSLRQNSFNKALMSAAIELLPENTEIEVFDSASIPPFNQDNEKNQAQIVNDFGAKIKSADAILIAMP